MIDDKTLTTGEIARHCGVHFRTVIRWIKRGELKSFKLPGRGDNRVRMEEFLSFLDKNDIPIPEKFKTKCNRVLIADDDSKMAKSIQRLLMRQGYQTVIAPDGFRAGYLLKSFSPSIVTLDLMMPGASGFDVLNYLKKADLLSKVKILVISSLPLPDLNRALEMGAHDILEKPFDNEVFLKKVQKLSGLDQKIN